MTTDIVLSHDRDNLASLIYLLPKYTEGGTFYVDKAMDTMLFYYIKVNLL